MVQNDRMTHEEPYRREVNVTRETTGTGTIVLIVIAGVLGLGLLYWIASMAWAPTPTSPTVVTPAPTESVPAPTPDDTLAPTEALPPATETAPIETPPADAVPAPEPAPEPSP